MMASFQFCQSSVADRSEAVTTAWTRHGGRTPGVAPLVSREWASRPPWHPPVCLSLHSSPPLCRAHRSRAPSSLCPSPIPSVRSTPAPSSTLSTPSLDRLSEGEAALADFATAAMCGTLPEFEVAVVGELEPFSSLPFHSLSSLVTS
jgi:hypothetical protein